MLKDIFHFVKQWLSGGEASLEFEFEITWIDALFFLAFLGLIIYALFTWV
jgi:hypothetical protein